MDRSSWLGRLLFVSCAAVLALGACSDHETSAPPTVHAIAPPVQPVVTVSRGSLSFASFKDENLDDCWDLKVELTTAADWTPPPLRLSLDQALALEADDVFGLARGYESVAGDEGQDSKHRFLLALTTGNAALLVEWLKSSSYAAEAREKKKAEATARKSAKKKRDMPTEAAPPTDAQLLKMFLAEERVAALKWPFPNIADWAKAGKAVRVDSCLFPGHVQLGACVVANGSQSSEVPRITWSIRRTHFGVQATGDTDSGLKACLRMGGKWEEPAVADAAVHREKMRQRLGNLR